MVLPGYKVISVKHYDLYFFLSLFFPNRDEDYQGHKAWSLQYNVNNVFIFYSEHITMKCPNQEDRITMAKDFTEKVTKNT